MNNQNIGAAMTDFNIKFLKLLDRVHSYVDRGEFSTREWECFREKVLRLFQSDKKICGKIFEINELHMKKCE